MNHNPRLDQDILNETYEDLKKLVHQSAHKVCKHYNVPFEDALSVANYWYVEAFAMFNPDKNVKLITWVKFIVDRRLISHFNKVIDDKFIYYAEINENLCGSEDHNSYLINLFSEIKEDAINIVKLLLDTPEELFKLIQWERRHTKNVRFKTLTEYFMDLGWEKEHIEKCLQSILQTLNPDQSKSEEQFDYETPLERFGLNKDRVIALTSQHA